jgi:hypothetical protein
MVVGGLCTKSFYYPKKDLLQTSDLTCKREFAENLSKAPAY